MLTPENLLFTTKFFTAFMLILLVYISFVLYIRNRREKEKKRYIVKTNALITRAIFFEDETDEVFSLKINRRITELLRKPRFRQTLITELVTSSNDLAGVAAENLSKLYKQLKLHEDSEKNLRNSRWHEKARAIRQLAIMRVDELAPTLYNLTNHKNEHIRMEAQTSIVKFRGFEGLTFLNSIKYPITEWHQLNLLKELSNLPAEDFKGIENWLKSSNDTVIIFALKLCASYHQFNQYDRIVECLKHVNPKVRLQAINCLKEIYEDTTSLQLINIYAWEPKTHQLAILKALKEIAAPDSISFLEKQLTSEDNQIVIAATRAIYNCGTEGQDVLLEHPSAPSYPLKQIISQVKMESVK